MQDRLDEAKAFVLRARAIKETLDLSSEPWTTFSILAQIAEKRGRAEEACQWRQKAEETQQAFDERSGYQAYTRILQQFDQVIQAVVAAANGNQQARGQVEARSESFKQGNWQIVDAIQRIWNGERDAAILTEGIDRNSAAIVRRILQLLAGATTGHSEPRSGLFVGHTATRPVATNAPASRGKHLDSPALSCGPSAG